MKFKFRAEKKDIVYFVVFALFLLYLIAIGSLNMYSLAQYQEWHGLNPIKAFTPEFIGSTVVFYLLALIGIIVSAGSHFWNKEKGFGFQSGKPEKVIILGGPKKMKSKRLKEINITTPTVAHAGCRFLSKRIMFGLMTESHIH